MSDLVASLEPPKGSGCPTDEFHVHVNPLRKDSTVDRQEELLPPIFIASDSLTLRMTGTSRKSPEHPGDGSFRAGSSARSILSVIATGLILLSIASFDKVSSKQNIQSLNSLPFVLHGRSVSVSMLDILETSRHINFERLTSECDLTLSSLLMES
ncbi:hypothetical protein C8J56DRAFT_1068389 [Mycena floridula]|nr:hypothetical protein C8J56DRAFT_1068389 [Mycena floridula]